MNENAALIQPRAATTEQVLLPQAEEPKECRQKRQELLKDYPISIEFLSIGCIISVGCKRIPFTSIEEAMKQLNEYVKDPHTARKVWFEIFEQQ